MKLVQGQIARSAKALTDNLSEETIEMHLPRIVDAFVRSAHGAGTFYASAITAWELGVAALKRTTHPELGVAADAWCHRPCRK